MKTSDVELGSEQSVPPQSSRDACVLHLVHGTFARDATWIRADSPFAQAVRRSLGEAVRPTPFDWTGANSHAARQRAGSALAQRILDLGQYHPGVPHYVIAHSHGGNVVAYALNRRGVRPLVAGVACLGTPFIKATARDLDGSRRLLQWILAAGLLFVAVLTFAASYGGTSLVLDPDALAKLVRVDPALGQGASEMLPSGWGRVALIAFYGLVAVGLGRLLMRPILGLRHFILQKELPRLALIQSDLVDSLTAKFESTPVLVVDARGDEAAWWLTTINRIAAIPYWIWKPTTFMVTGMALISLLMFVSLLFSRPDSSGFGTILAGLVVALFLFAFSTLSLAAAGWLLCLIWPAIFRAHALGFGRDDFLQNFAVEIRSAQTPERSAHLRRETVTVSGRGLRHSRLYQDDRVQSAVIEWLGQLQSTGPSPKEDGRTVTQSDQH